jgi:enoyl-CoA hydratase
MNYLTLVYNTDGPIATITLNRPEDLNTIVSPMTDEIEGELWAISLLHRSTPQP